MPDKSKVASSGSSSIRKVAFASLIGTCKMNGVEPYAYLRDLFISIANGHPAKDIDALMPWVHSQRLISSE